jgi:hypothetical protein
MRVVPASDVRVRVHEFFFRVVGMGPTGNAKEALLAGIRYRGVVAGSGGERG